MIRHSLVVAVATLMVAGTALAQSPGTAKAVTGRGQVVVWKSLADFQVALALIRAQQFDLANRELSCSIAPGTRLSKLDSSWSGTTQVLVMSGPQRGCEGTILVEEFAILKR